MLDLDQAQSFCTGDIITSMDRLPQPWLVIACAVICVNLLPGSSLNTAAADPSLTAKQNPRTGHVEIREGVQPVLRYNFGTNEPGPLLAQVHPDNHKYARARGNYIHPLYGLNGEVLTCDWSLDHPHHRGIYWAWPEVDFRGERGDLHALQRVFARPHGECRLVSGPKVAEIIATNLWLWEDRQPIVREQTIIRVYPTNQHGRCIDLEFQFTALEPGVAIARRGTEHYGGLNIRLAPVTNQVIAFHTDPITVKPRKSWGELSGTFAGAPGPTSFIVFQHQDNPAYPGDWIKYPELNWLQPTFPAAGTRHALNTNQPLVLRYRLWIRPGQTAPETLNAEQWLAYHDRTSPTP
jgi:hypothetical protein